ncbi:MAG: hypothetical protein Q8K82_20765 [Gemmatimonadaceae bacterium]|nr:hypothetical protein [Gemmatimonadaceae bacterium]
MPIALLDANCFIAASQTAHPEHAAASRVFALGLSGRATLVISQHTLLELANRPDAAYELAKGLQVVPCFPFGRIQDLAGPISGLGGTIGQIGASDRKADIIGRLARSGSSLRDRGAVLDAIEAHVDFFVTSDRALVDLEPARRLHDRYGLRFLTPGEFCLSLDNP